MHVRKHVWRTGWRLSPIKSNLVCLHGQHEFLTEAKCKMSVCVGVVWKDRRAKPFHIPIQQQFPLIVTTCSDKSSISKWKLSGRVFGLPWIFCHSIRPHCSSLILFGTEWSHKRVNQELGAEYPTLRDQVSVAVLVKYVRCVYTSKSQHASACLAKLITFANSDLSHCDTVTYFIPRFCPCHFLMESITTSWKHTMSV